MSPLFRGLIGAAAGGGGVTFPTHWPGQPTWPAYPVTAMGGPSAVYTINGSDSVSPFWYAFSGPATIGKAELWVIYCTVGGSLTVTATKSPSGFPYPRIANAAGTILSSYGGSSPNYTSGPVTLVAGNFYFIEIFQGNAGEVTYYTLTLSGTATLGS